MSWLFASGGQSVGASAAILPVNIQGWFLLGLTGLISFLSKGFSRVFSSTRGLKSESESCSVVSNSLRAHGLYSPWNFPGQNTGVGSLFLFSRGSSQPRDQTQVSRITGGFFTRWATREAHQRFESINSLALSLLHDSTITSVHNFWKKHSFDYMDLSWQSDIRDHGKNMRRKNETMFFVFSMLALGVRYLSECLFLCPSQIL